MHIIWTSLFKCCAFSLLVNFTSKLLLRVFHHHMLLPIFFSSTAPKCLLTSSALSLLFMKSLFWKTAYPCLVVRLFAFLVDLKSLWPCPDDHVCLFVFSFGPFSCLFLPSDRGFLNLLAYFFTFHSSPRRGRCFHWHNFDINSRIEQFSQISCKFLLKCLEHSGSVFCLCSFCHVAWLLTMFSLLTCIGRWFACYV